MGSIYSVMNQSDCDEPRATVVERGRGIISRGTLLSIVLCQILCSSFLTNLIFCCSISSGTFGEISDKQWSKSTSFSPWITVTVNLSEYVSYQRPTETL